MSLFYGYLLPYSAVESLGFSSTEMSDFISDHGLQYHKRLYECYACDETSHKHYAGLELPAEIHGLTEIIETVDDSMVHNSMQELLESLQVESQEPVASYNEDNWAMMIVTVPLHRNSHQCDNCVGELVDRIAENYQNQPDGPP